MLSWSLIKKRSTMNLIYSKRSKINNQCCNCFSDVHKFSIMNCFSIININVLSQSTLRWKTIWIYNCYPAPYIIDICSELANKKYSDVLNHVAHGCNFYFLLLLNKVYVATYHVEYWNTFRTKGQSDKVGVQMIKVQSYKSTLVQCHTVVQPNILGKPPTFLFD